jgi:hypothetical protein
LAVAAALPAARQKPAAHAVQDAWVVKVVPPALHVPTGHAVLGAAEPVPAGQ